jgi:hypothetical protein
MAELKHGALVLTLPDDLVVDERAGKLSTKEIRRIPKVPRGVGVACAHAADAMRKAGGSFTPPAKITPDGLEAAGRRANGIDQVIVDAEVLLRTLKQANLLFDAAAWEQLRKVNDQVKAQAKHAPELLAIFRPLIDFFAHAPSRTQPEPAEKP